ncbi:LTA synthase family protein [Leptospira stimsonii]|uniref:Alkaline phosphatase family protein n=1 Tax=Leptospira stimsonii TaxID=2202203 RepID=A0ABY2NDC1_9LEPT|nr:alkaline phosphatase family protein [Leptospira stimsonii]TGK14181.1 alkaline phosphatase family protein [Leptospira stimsonii]TGM22034.1 alkaline phosphatase family protein [Leptospira stimsonii]
MFQRIPTHLKLIFSYVVYFAVILLLYKIAFLSVYWYRLHGVPLDEIAIAFLLGFRFDLAVIGMTLGLFAFLSVLPYLNRFKAYRFFWGYTPILLGIWMIAHLIADIIYFENANKHIGYEGFVFIGKDLGVILKSALEQNTTTFIIGIGFLLIFLPVSTWLFLKYNPYEYKRESWKTYGAHLGIVLILTIIAVRGGIQESPIRATNAIVSGNNFVNNIALNGVFTSIMDLKSQSIPKFLKLEMGEAVTIVRKEIEYSGAEFVSEKYPILRVQKETNPGTPPNIVLIMLENWTGKFIRPISDGLVEGKEVAPHFNQLLKKGRFYNRFIASGGRTTNGMMSILTGIPDRPGLTVVRTHQVLGNFSGIGSIFKRMGYETFFVTGGDLSFDNKSTLMPHWGFDTVMGEKEISKLGRFKLGAWGYDDADVLQLLHERISASKKPILGLALTLTTHYPYRTPSEKFRIFGPETRDYDFLNVYNYADWAVHNFITQAEKSGYFKNTIFVFVADHTHHRYLDYYEDRNVPFLIYAPGRIAPALDETIASQLDVIPTILGLVGKKVTFSAMGRNLLAPGRTQTAYFAYGNLFGWIENEHFYLRFFDGIEDLSYNIVPPREKNNFCEKDPSVCEEMSKKAKAYLNLSYDLLNKNIVFPSETELIQLNKP